MSPADTALTCIAAAVGLGCIAPAAFDAWHRPRTIRHFQATARQAARTEATVAEDAASHRRQREIALLEAWLATPCHPRNTIPHQTRRTEEDQ
jgi:hypothetical protein